MRAKPNGSCLFISLRLGLECSKLLKMQTPGIGLLDGFDNRVVESAERLRHMIIEWYSNGLTKELPGFDCNAESKPGQEGFVEKPWTRADLLAMESANLYAQDIPESGPDRLKVVLRYLEHVKAPRVWGGVPEYTAFSFMSKLTVEVYVRDVSMAQHGQPALHGLTALQQQQGLTALQQQQGLTALQVPHGHAVLRLYQKITPPQSLGTVRILFNGSNHYDLLLNEEDASSIKRLLPVTKLLKIN